MTVYTWEEDNPELSTLNQYALDGLQAMMMQEVQNASIGGTIQGGGNDGVSTPPVLFGMELHYDDGNPELDAFSQYNGNISWIEWKNAGENYHHKYGFDYDGANRLKKAKYASKDYVECEDLPEDAFTIQIHEYDKIGNIQSLTRNGYKGLDTNGDPIHGLIDELSYNYTGTSILQSVTESSNILHGFKKSAIYDHDDDTGNLISDTGKGISSISYNYLDLPEIILINGGEIQNVYDANGRKLKQSTFKQGVLQKEIIYCDGIEYLNGNLGSVYHEEGRVVYNGNIPNQTGGPIDYEEYYLKDHLGNTRVRFVDKNGDGAIQIDLQDSINNELTATYNYYPFGMEWDVNFVDPQPISNRYRYNSKEFIEDFGLEWSDYGARYYDAAVGRFITVDPLADQMPAWSPYSYTFNNPISFIDPDGREAEWIFDQQKDGSYARREGVANDGGENFHTFHSNDGTTTYVDTKVGTAATVDNNVKGDENAGVTTYTLAGVLATPVGGLSFNIGIASDEKGTGVVASGGIAVGLDASIGFEVTESHSTSGENIYMENLRGESRSSNVGILMLDYGEGGGHTGESTNIFERQSTIQSHTIGVSISSTPLAGSRQVEGTLVGRFRYK